MISENLLNIFDPKRVIYIVEFLIFLLFLVFLKQVSKVLNFSLDYCGQSEEKIKVYFSSMYFLKTKNHKK